MEVRKEELQQTRYDYTRTLEIRNPAVTRERGRKEESSLVGNWGAGSCCVGEELTALALTKN